MCHVFDYVRKNDRTTTNHLRNSRFSRKVVTDNGPSFTSEEFRSFLSQNGITHVTSSPYHPSSNGLAERAVQTLKNGLKQTPGATIQEKLSKYLFTYRITPQTTTGVTPAQLLMGRSLRSRLDRLFPDVAARVESRQTRQAQQHDNSRSLRTFKVNDTVYVRDFTSSSTKWLPGTVVTVTGDLCHTTFSPLRERQSVATSMPSIHVMFLFSLHNRSRSAMILLRTTFSCRTYPHLAPQLTTPTNPLTFPYVDRLDIVLHLTVSDMS